MNLRITLLLLIVLLQRSGALIAGGEPEKPLSFEGYVLTDSLEYSAESIDYYFDEKKIVLKNNANITYLGRLLTSNTITYYQDYEYMEALGREDSTGTLTDTPVFKDQGGEDLKGREIKYNINSQKGIVLDGVSEYDKGFMYASTIKRVSDDTLYISNGSYTTCDDEKPHYYFAGRQMKFILNDKLIIKPIIGYLYDIPVVWFPFYIFPISQGRQSGFLMPRYGSSRQDGRYFSNLGYYWAPSDYFDYRTSSTLREKNGWLINNWINYNKRYSMQGSIYGSFENEPREGTRQWRLTGSHSHTVSPTLNMAGTVNMQSSRFSKNNSSNYYQRMNRNMNSQFSVTKKWKDSGNSLIASVSHTKNLDSESRTTVGPKLSFRMPKRLIFGQDSKNAGGSRKYTTKSSDIVDTADRAWYKNIYYSLNANFSSTERDDYSKSDSSTDIYDLHEFQSLKQLGLDTSISSSYNLFGWLAANPSITFDEQMVASTDSIAYTREENLRAGLSLSTKVYGTFNPSVGKLKALRHVITPSLSYSYGRGRYHEGLDTDVLYRFDRDDTEGRDGIRSRMSLNLRNLFQAKMIDGDKETKIDLFTLNFRTDVDLEDFDTPVGPLSSTLDLKPSKAVSIRLTSTHDFYHEDSFELFNPFLTNMGVTTTIGLSDKSAGLFGTSSNVNANKNLGRDLFDRDIDEPDTEMESPGTQTGKIPFKLSLTHSYSIRRGSRKASGKYDYTETHTIKPTLSFNPSKNFSVKYNLYYDIVDKNLTTHRLSINRDLHCWEGSLSWVPSGVREGFYMLINIKQLPDVKIEKRRGTSSYSG